MLRAVCHELFFFTLFYSVSAIDIEFPHCNCNGDGMWITESILQFQKVSDFLIAVAYFSIPFELLYFVTCSRVFPFKWVLFQFGAFLVLCGLTHLLNVFTFDPHSFILMLSLTISKFLTALVSFVTAIILLTLIPHFLRVKVRETFLRIRARELYQVVGLMKRQEEARWHVRMLTQEIRKSLDMHTILYTTLVELSKILALQNCAVWMPNGDKMELNLTHELRLRHSLSNGNTPIPLTDPDVMEIGEAKGVKILRPFSVLGLASIGGGTMAGQAAAIRMPMLNISNFKEGTPQVIQASYVILVLVLPKVKKRVWSSYELEIVEVVADQVAVTLSHAAVLEESQLMRDKLEEQNSALLQAKKDALMASEARNLFQRVMSQGMRQPFHSSISMSSMLQQENLNPEQNLTINTILNTSCVISTLINDVMETSSLNSDMLDLEMRPFNLHSMIMEVAISARSLCEMRGYGFRMQIENEVPAQVVGDKKRIFQVLLHMFDNVITNGCREGSVTFYASSVNEMQDKRDWMQLPWKSTFHCSLNFVKFEIGIDGPTRHGFSSLVQNGRGPNSEGLDTSFNFSMCRNIVQLMQGNISAVPASHGLSMKIVLLLPFQQPNKVSEVTPPLEPNYLPPSPLLQGLRVLLVDCDDVNRFVTRKLLEKLGCHVTSASSGIECLHSLGTCILPFQVVILDICMRRFDGFEVATRIQRFSSQFLPSIVALTTSDKEEELEKCFQLRINGLIHKPVMLQDLGNELYRVLQNM